MRVPRRDRAATRLSGLVLLGGLLLAVGSPAHGTVREWLMQQAGLDPTVLRSAPSARLAGLGRVDLCVRDEANEINTRDFGLNVAGVLEDSDGWVIESWLAGHRQQTNRPDRDSKRSYGNSGAQVVYRSQSTALGLDYNWTFFEATDHPGDWSRVRGPLASALVNHRFGRLVLGAVVGSEGENESRTSENFFAIRHKQTRWVGQLGAQVPVGPTLVALGWDFERGNVEGKSVDPARFHEDELTWVRPLDRYSVAVIVPGADGLEAGLRARYMDRTGGETEVISWSDTSPENPSKELFRRPGLSTFREEETDADVAGRARLDVGRLTVGIEASYRTWEWSAIEASNFKGSNRAGSLSSDALQAAAGVSTRLLQGRMLAAVQGEVGQEDWEEAQSLETRSGTARHGTLGAGLELFVYQDVVLRGGFWLTSQDGDVNEPLTLSRGRGLSAGASWLPRGGTVQLHGGLRHTKTKPDEEGSARVDDKSELSFLLGLRILI